MKTQAIRLADVFVIGPLMMWGGMQLRGKHPRRGNLLALLGAGTVVYNGRNWWLKRRRLSKSGGSRPPVARAS